MSTSTTETGGSRRRYAFRYRLGQGGFGEVYRATLHTGGVSTEVAVKLLRREFAVADSQAARRMRDEARFLALLRHPAIVGVLDLVALDGRLALVTEYVDGEDLRWAVRRSGCLPVRCGVEMIARVADALHAAMTTTVRGHEGPMRLTHRDVKPANVFVSRHGEVKLLDFGVARTDELARAARTAAHSIVVSGTYAPPEALIIGSVPDVKGDVWSLAITAFEALTAERMFPGMNRRDLARLVAGGDPRAFVLERLGTGGLPDDVHALLVDMVALEPEDRPSPLAVMQRADDLAERSPGPSLRTWARERTWQPRPQVRSPLDGRVIEEQPIESLVDPPVRILGVPPLPTPDPAPPPDAANAALRRGAALPLIVLVPVVAGGFFLAAGFAFAVLRGLWAS